MKAMSLYFCCAAGAASLSTFALALAPSPTESKPKETMDCKSPYGPTNSTFLGSKKFVVVRKFVAPGESGEICISHDVATPPVEMRCMRREYRDTTLPSWKCPLFAPCYEGGSFTDLQEAPTRTCVTFVNHSGTYRQEAIVQFKVP